MDDARLVQEVHADCGVARQREHHARVDNGGLVLQQPRAGLSFGRPSFYSIRAARSSTCSTESRLPRSQYSVTT
jgi:hypothetical protein